MCKNNIWKLNDETSVFVIRIKKYADSFSVEEIYYLTAARSFITMKRLISASSITSCLKR